MKWSIGPLFAILFHSLEISFLMRLDQKSWNGMGYGQVLPPKASACIWRDNWLVQLGRNASGIWHAPCTHDACERLTRNDAFLIPSTNKGNTKSQHSEQTFRKEYRCVSYTSGISKYESTLSFLFPYLLRYITCFNTFMEKWSSKVFQLVTSNFKASERLE